MEEVIEEEVIEEPAEARSPLFRPYEWSRAPKKRFEETYIVGSRAPAAALEEAEPETPVLQLPSRIEPPEPEEEEEEEDEEEEAEPQEEEEQWTVDEKSEEIADLYGLDPQEVAYCRDTYAAEIVQDGLPEANEAAREQQHVTRLAAGDHPEAETIAAEKATDEWEKTLEAWHTKWLDYYSNCSTEVVEDIYDEVLEQYGPELD